MLRLSTSSGEVFNITAQRLVRYGCTEPEAYALAKIIILDPDATDDAVTDAVCLALVSVKQAVDARQGADGIADIEYVTGRRCDLQRRLEGRS